MNEMFYMLFKIENLPNLVCCLHQLSRSQASVLQPPGAGGSLLGREHEVRSAHPLLHPQSLYCVLTQRLRQSSTLGGVTQVSRSLQVLLGEHVQTVIKSGLVAFKTHPESDRRSTPPPPPPRSRPPQPLPGSQVCSFLPPSSCPFPPNRNESISPMASRTHIF